MKSSEKDACMEKNVYYIKLKDMQFTIGQRNCISCDHKYYIKNDVSCIMRDMTETSQIGMQHCTLI